MSLFKLNEYVIVACVLLLPFPCGFVPLRENCPLGKVISRKDAQALRLAKPNYDTIKLRKKFPDEMRQTRFIGVGFFGSFV